MANYALLSNNKVVHHHIAASLADLGNDALIYEVVDVSGIYPQPSVGWTREDGVWFPPRTVDKTDLIDAEDIFSNPAAIAAAVASIEAPKSESSEEKKTK
jgi:hypothetical protein